MSIKISTYKMADNKFRDGKFFWSVARLIQHTNGLEVFEIPLKGIYIGQNVWEDINSPLKLAKHIKQTMEADLDYPIILDDTGFIMDGWHRIAKALYLGKETIKAVRFEKLPNPCGEEEQ